MLSSAPWWPAGWPDRGGPEERGDPRGGALALGEIEAAECFGSVAVSDARWQEYASRAAAAVAPSPAAEAAVTIVRNRELVLRDAQACRALPADADAAAYDAALRAVVCMLAADGDTSACTSDADAAGSEATPGADGLAAYLDERLCVPRDMGAPAALAIRQLHWHLNGVERATDGASPPPSADVAMRPGMRRQAGRVRF